MRATRVVLELFEVGKPAQTVTLEPGQALGMPELPGYLKLVGVELVGPCPARDYCGMGCD